MEDHKPEILRLIKDMDVPAIRRDLDKPWNVDWLSRNLVVRNHGHENFREAIELIRKQRRLNDLATSRKIHDLGAARHIPVPPTETPQ